MRGYPDSYKVRFGHRLFDGDGIRIEARAAFTCLLRIRTNPNVEAVGTFSSSWGRGHLDWEARTFKLQGEPELVGADALNRESSGTRCGWRDATSRCYRPRHSP